MKFNRNIAYTNKIFLLTKAIYVALKSHPYNEKLDNPVIHIQTTKGHGKKNLQI